ncbi:hypothetical protein Tsubulata_046118 [Turnera subulata]|uniref:Bms1-type G domain-containing protein n=1 Tax=Turnera subulata TaxID=218843 RepID=A0A9Q0GJW8_9ROSI|nr:hypothetical protein Tsubulata_046118 [Turnera subulata]
MDQSHKAHRTRQAGPKKKSKSDKKKKRDDNSTEEKKQNPKAFAFSSSVKAKRLQSRSVEKEQRRLHVPTIDRSYGEPAPYVVVVQGPPGVGKSLLIKNLVKHYTKHNLPEVRGPITIVSGKQRRVQFVECPNDINCMIDAAKFADLALLLVDASYGFEMEFFEFLNILKVHGFPKIMGVLTHLDKFNDVKKLKKTKQRLKHRFWTETCDGAKLFYLSGLIHGKYPKREIHNLARFISVMKFRPLTWRTSHPYLLVDRLEDVTPPERMHIAGVGDYSLSGVSALADPCPLPSAAKKKGLRDKEKLFYAPMSGIGELLYDKDAVYININDHLVQFSKTDNEHGEATRKGKQRDVGVDLVKSLQKTKYSIDEKLGQSRISLFGRDPAIPSQGQHDVDGHEAAEQTHDPVTLTEHAPPVGSDEENGAEDLDSSESSDQDGASQMYGSDSDDENGETPKEKANRKGCVKEKIEFHGGRLRRKVVFGDDIDDKDLKDSDDGMEEDDDDADDVNDHSHSGSDFSDDDGEDQNTDDDMGNISKWKVSLAERTIPRKHINLMQLVYGKSASMSTTSVNEEQDDSDDGESDGDEFFKPKGQVNKKLSESLDGANASVEDCSKFTNFGDLKNWKQKEVYESIRDRFVTGDWSKAAQRNELSETKNEDDEDSMYGDFEDLETGEKYEGHQQGQSGDGSMRTENDQAAEERRLKKLALRAKFDAQYPFN